MKKTNVTLKIPEDLYQKIQADLESKHPIALERLGFVYSGYKQIDKQNHLILLNEYGHVDDLNYIEDHSVGGRVNSTAIRTAVNENLKNQKGCFAVHQHLNLGIPKFSPTDLKELPRIAETFTRLFPKNPHGLLLFSKTDILCLVWLPNRKTPVFVDKCVIVGQRIQYSILGQKKTKQKKRYVRQSFLGVDSQVQIENTKIGLVGLGGGGSHVAQQLAYLGFKNIALIDPDKVEESNLNRLVGASAKNAQYKTLKVAVAKRMIKRVIPISNIQCSPSTWQSKRTILENCDIVMGCLDSYLIRRDLEAFCRLHLIPYIDIGMVVNKYSTHYSMVGQAICSIPGNPCMQCLGFINELVLKEEAEKYGDAGDQPQVVWANGILASTAVGIALNLITAWTDKLQTAYYLSYDGNNNLIFDHPRLNVNGKLVCSHYPIERTGGFKALS